MESISIINKKCQEQMIVLFFEPELIDDYTCSQNGMDHPIEP
jgi:hypothetical protein